jgi:hypothetical protein
VNISSDAVLGTANEQTLIAVAHSQLAKAYGVGFRLTPVVFITDDNDYFDNDDASPELLTFPHILWDGLPASGASGIRIAWVAPVR